MRPAILGRPSWSTGTGEEPAGLPLLRVPHLLACSGGVTRLDCPVTGTPLSAPGRWRHGAIRLGRGCWRANLLQVASEASLNVFCAVGVQRAQPFGAGLAGVRPRSQSFPLAPCFSEKHLSNGKLFKARVSRGLLPFGAGGWGRRESPAFWEQRQPSAVGGAALPFWLGHPPSGWPWGRRLRCPAQWPEVAGDLVEPRVPLDGVGQVLHAEVNRTQRDALTVRVGAEVVQGARLAALAVLAD